MNLKILDGVVLTFIQCLMEFFWYWMIPVTNIPLVDAIWEGYTWIPLLEYDGLQTCVGPWQLQHPTDRSGGSKDNRSGGLKDNHRSTLLLLLNYIFSLFQFGWSALFIFNLIYSLHLFAKNLGQLFELIKVYPFSIL